MSTASQPHIFLSYSRKDGEVFAGQLRRALEINGFALWQDVVALQGGRDWWSQIEEALRAPAMLHFVLVVTPESLKSGVVRREIRLARQEGKTVSPVKGPGLSDLNRIPRWLGQIFDLDRKEHWATLLRVLEGPSQQNRVPMMAPEPPPDFIKRPAEFDALKKRLLDYKGDAVAITAALKGAGGYGKTTLAKALAHDPDIQDAYFDGILWVELGDRPTSLLKTISDLIALISGTPRALETINAAATALAETLGDRRFLLIIDDAWRAQDLKPLLQGGPNTTRLVTTRLDRVVPESAFRQPVDAMRQAEAVDLLTWGLPVDQAHALGGELKQLSVRLGEWALLIKLVNGFLRQRVERAREPLARAIQGVNRRLDEKGLAGFDAGNESDRSKAVARTIEVSLELLDEVNRTRFGELGIFPEDADVPIDVVARLWQESGRLDEFASEDLLIELLGLSLILSIDLEHRTVRIHDTVRHFLRDQAGKNGLEAQHKQLLRALIYLIGASKADPIGRRYSYLWLPHHLVEAGEREKLDALLVHPSWLQDKLTAVGSMLPLVEDCANFGRQPLASLIGRALRLSAGILARDQRQLMPQLIGRVLGAQDPDVLRFLDLARARLPSPILVPTRASLTQPGAETDRLEGHDGAVTLAVLPDGRLASGSVDETIRLWDLSSGAETARLEAHDGTVSALAVLPDGRLASSSLGTIRLWDIERGIAIAQFGVRGRAINALAVLPDGRLASGSGDKTIRLWDLRSGAETARLEGHADNVNALAVLPDGRLASGSGDKTIRLWDLKSGAETARLEGHAWGVNALAVLPDGRLASGSADKTIRLWDLRSGAETARLEGHGRSVHKLAVLPDGRLASGSDDRTIRLWDLKSSTKTTRLMGHALAINALAVLPDGRLASGSTDKMIRLWDLKRGNETARLEGHALAITALAVLPDGRLASGSTDKTIRLWDLKRGSETARLEAHDGTVSALAVLPDGRLASSSLGPIRLWDLERGMATARLTGHTWGVDALAVLPDGRLASVSFDKAINLWDLKSGATARLEGHADIVNALAVLPDGRLASGSRDKTIRLWDLKNGAETARIEGHADIVNALAVLPDGRLASGSRDKTIRLWDLKTSAEIARLEVDAAVFCVAALPDGRLVAGDEIGRLHWLEVR